MAVLEKIKGYSSINLGAYAVLLGTTLKLGGVANGYWHALMRRKVVAKLRKKYKKQTAAFGDAIEAADASLDHGKGDTVWVCWFQGMENAPPVVQACYRSVCRAMEGKKKVVVITRENYAQYAEFPRFITERFEAGIISPALFSDLLRTELLIRHGGTWIDATVFLSGDSPAYMFESDFFCFHTAGNGWLPKATSMESWFLTSCRNQKILLLAQKLLYLYLEKEKTPADYFIWYDFMQLAVERFAEAWAQVPPVSCDPCELLEYMLLQPYRKENWDVITANSSIHKLTYHFAEMLHMSEKEVGEAVARNDTYYAHITEGIG